MSKHFTAINRITGEQWKSTNGSYLVMYDSGFLAEVVEDYYTFMKPLDTSVWKTIIKEPMQQKLDKQTSSKEY